MWKYKTMMASIASNNSKSIVSHPSTGNKDNEKRARIMTGNHVTQIQNMEGRYWRGGGIGRRGEVLWGGEVLGYLPQ